MRSFVLSLAATLAFAGVAFAQAPEVLRGSSTTIQKKAAAPAKHAAVQHTATVQKTAAVQKAAAVQHSAAPTRTHVVTPQSLRGSGTDGAKPP